MDNYIKKWFDILNGMSNDNTYKLAWGRAIIEAIVFNEGSIIDDHYRIHFDRISMHILKYYWNQSFFFNLKQSARQSNPPVVVQLTDTLIDYYKSKVSNIPVWFDKVKSTINNEILQNKVHQISTVLTQNVSWRFLKIEDETVEIYVLNNKERYIELSLEDVESIKSYHEILIQLFNYKWAQLLEKYNIQPRIVSKIKGSSDNQLKRNNLSKYKDILLLLYKDEIKDFYTDETLNFEDISIDHFIPWSYMYSDDLWNLVITSKSRNSSKSNRPPTKEYIQKLEERNRKLLEVIQDSNHKAELMESLEHHYITKFYQSLIS
ncbi:hypothetical protein N7603_02905 [Acholeplasma vituli]|uniref:HNH nuclease domain-containing protein n=1 Tax=Paracholeplasma vituli TaxID=69473 RepID=A0ABT2PUU4_9MOLU|nr:HNH endonuclease domain-containing protein [Paracholeplasma vituli]MCU0104600.1 hypothetical protein [Paracholeplasma vituli]